MTTTVETEVKQTIPLNIERSRTFAGFYHYKHSAPQCLVFDHKGDLRSAKERFGIHCQRMGYRYIQVRPFIVDLDDREKRRNEEGSFETSEL